MSVTMIGAWGRPYSAVAIPAGLHLKLVLSEQLTVRFGIHLLSVVLRVALWVRGGAERRA